MNSTTVWAVFSTFHAAVVELVGQKHGIAFALHSVGSTLRCDAPLRVDGRS
jgi:hypothetical protein